MINTLGVCSWSLQTQKIAELLQCLDSCGLTRIQIALSPLLDQESELRQLRDAVELGNVTLCSGMLATIGEDYSTLGSIKSTGGLRSDANWAENLRLAERCAGLAAQLGLKLVTLHAGFIPEDDAALRQVMVDRLCRAAEVFNRHEIVLGLETGQETASTLRDLLSTIIPRVEVGVNFDPANMILYDMGDPIDAMRGLQEHIVQVHMKDAISTDTPGTWGTEVAAGVGQVEWEAFFKIVQGLPQEVDVVIERESGEQRVEDIRQAAALARAKIQRVSS